MSGTPPNPSRRDYLRGGGALVVGGLLAGCSDNGSNSANGQTDTSDTGDTSSTAGETTSNDGGPYSVSMSPMGNVEFDDVPESAFVIFPQYADMAVALGHGDAVNAIYVPEMSGKTMNTYYDRLDGVSFEWKDLPNALGSSLSEEQLYQLDSDVHFADPAYVSTQKNWSKSDVEKVGKNVGPWFGNFYSGTNGEPPKGYRDGYQYYGLWDMFGKVADVFQEKERYDAIKGIHDDVISTIKEKLPPKTERPTAVRVTYSDGKFYTYHLNKPGYWLADTRPLAAKDAFAEKDWGSLWGTVDYETMLEVDPDVILHLWGVSPGYYVQDMKKKIQNHPAGGKLSAIENDRFYASGMRYQGPLMNLFQLEMTAKQLYPDQFGEWPGYEKKKPYPEIPEDERLFDRTKLADIVTGK
ncbi:ABC transporter substrate-binding protein [Haladaptatus sp. AB643]|uniref:ABC transporter substrate-binding protein n=1 Tax=Haladaptatus sp. AB643 TaxID=2934174 RepID=UPI00209C5176|nr:ABC transporter substrate-binding protein [Haladaptatus sp. AB643]MCO8244317.1 ABC transporter substrate-binding protein [Haladaptatus sp. AB643]